MALLLAISSPYTMFQGTLMGGTTIVTPVIAVYIMIRFSHLGQSFVNKVSGPAHVPKCRTLPNVPTAIT